MSYPVIDRFRLVNYTYDREFVIITTNVSDSGGWETSVFANDPDTDIRDFESLVEQILFSHKGDANHFHREMLYKWNTIEADISTINI